MAQGRLRLPISDADRCLLRDSVLLTLSNPDAAGLLHRRSNIAGWHKYWFSLHGSQLLYFERGQQHRRALLVGSISLFRHSLTLINTVKRRREFEIAEVAGKLHVLRANSDSELHWWLQLFAEARRKIPPAHPIVSPNSTPSSPASHPVNLPNTVIDSHIRVDHLLCVVHGIGVDEGTLSSNIRLLQDSLSDVMAKVFPDLDFHVELLVVHWRNALTNLGVHEKLRAVVPRAPVIDHQDANPLKNIMEHVVVDYVYYTHPRYRRHMLREVSQQLNRAVADFRIRRPDFSGKISVMGHSLGAALCYDLMTRRVRDDQALLEAEGMRLSFDAETLFCLGSPLGTLTALDPDIGLASDVWSLPFRTVNVFKNQDPVATRLEPLRDLRWADVRPVMVPCWHNMGMRESTAKWVGSLWAGQRALDEPEYGRGLDSARGRNHAPVPQVGSADMTDIEIRGDSSKKQSSSSNDDSNRPASNNTYAGNSSGFATVLSLNQGTQGKRSTKGEKTVAQDDGGFQAEVSKSDIRLDFELQASSTMEEVSTSWSAVKSHNEYWGSRDVMLLMVSRMIKSSFGIDDYDDLSARDRDLALRVVNENVLSKEQSSTTDISQNSIEGGTIPAVQSGNRNNQDMDLKEYVQQVVERVIEEAASTHELVRLHPSVRLRDGGVGVRSPAGSEVSTGDRNASWASYLTEVWFGSEAATPQS